MKAIGSLPEDISLLDTINSIGENIVIADSEFNIVWMNSSAADLLSKVAPLYGLTNVDQLIGMNMNAFHHNPVYQRKVMDELDKKHRARITIKDRFVADIVISEMEAVTGNWQGYVVMLMDVTTKAEEDREKEKLIQALSVPMITVWERTIAIPLIGEFDKERSDRMITSVLAKCSEDQILYVLVDLSGLYRFENETKHELQKLHDCLKLVGTECVLVGISPKLAMSAGEISSDLLTFNTAYAGLKYIIGQSTNEKDLR